MVCEECVVGFFSDPIKMGISLLSVILSVWFFLMMQEENSAKAKVAYVYAHIFTLLFPFMYYAFTNTCYNAFSFAFCSAIKPMVGIITITFVASLIAGYLLTPLLLRMSSKNTDISSHAMGRFVRNEAREQGIEEPTLHLMNMQKPIAFCISVLKPRIYISLGMVEMLSRKEREAVLLHEIGHIKAQSSSLKLSTYLQRLASPFSRLVDLSPALVRSERQADEFAIGVQGSARYLESARRKMECYEREERVLGKRA